MLHDLRCVAGTTAAGATSAVTTAAGTTAAGTTAAGTTAAGTTAAGTTAAGTTAAGMLGTDPADGGVAELRLVCLVRSGDGYVVRGAGRLTAANDTRAHLDISFGDAGDRRAAAALDLAVRSIQRWCELGTPVSLLATTDGVTLRGNDGTAVPLPRCAA